MEWKEIELDQFILFNPKVDLKVGDKAKKIAMTDLIEFNKKINSYEYSLFAGGAKFQNHDTLLARITPCLENGKTAYVDILKDDESAFGSTEFIVLRGKQNISNSQFIYYLSISHDFRNIAIQAMTGSSGRQRVQLDLLQKTIMLLPPLPEQRAIAEILSSIDDKIELNNQMNRTLEAMAQAIFKQWFVDFKFPQNSKASDSQNPLLRGEGGPLAVGDALSLPKCEVKMIDSELGPIPEGWRVGIIDDIAEVVGGGTPSTKIESYFVKDAIPWITPKDLSGYTYKYIQRGSTDITEEALKNSSARLLPAGTVLFSSRAPIGYITIAENPVSTNQGFKSLIPKSDMKTEYLYQYIKMITPDIESRASGSTFKEISGSAMKQIKIIIPENSLIDTFEEIIKPLNEQIKVIKNQNITLSALRDSLLPKLMSGELRVPEEIVKRYEETVSEA